MLVFYFFAGLVLLQSLISLRGGRRYLAYVRREVRAPAPSFTPFASVVVPCRGVDDGLRENLSALFAQDYPAYELIFVSDSSDDPALEVARALAEGVEGGGGPASRFVVAGRATDSGQKVHNLRAAVREADARCEALVFVDTDARPARRWLRSLVAPIQDAGVGAATGYRWFVPPHLSLASHLRAVWNASIASALGEDGTRNFCWGGSTAVRRETFERLGVAEAWRGAASDDFALTRVLHDAALPIRFVPACLTPSLDRCRARELLEFTTRQLKITRVYAPRLWQIVLYSNLLFTLVFFGGAGLVAARAARGLPFAWPLALLCAIYALGTTKAALRLRAVALAIPEHRRRVASGAWAHLTLWPLTSVLFLYNALAAAASRRIRWRGITYELKSPSETDIMR